MAIFSKHFMHNKQDSQKSRSTPERPKLYVSASRPSVPNQSSTSEWSLDLCISPAGSNIKTPTSSAPTSRRTSVAEEVSATTQNTLDAAAGQLVPAKHYYFSRLHAAKHIEESPKDMVVQIYLTSFPSQATAQSDHQKLVDQFSETLEAVHLTSDSASWLRQALFALQISEIIPPVSHGLDINKVMSFATSYLEQHLQHGAGSTSCGEVNYSQVLRQNERLRRMLSSDTTDYAVVDVKQGRLDVSGDEDDIWNLPSRPKPAKAEKTWGGFWVTHGSGGASRGNSRSNSRDRHPLERKDVYGGLM